MEGEDKMNLKEKIINNEAIIGIIGLGYVGLPLAVSSALCGYKVIGIDTNKDKINKIIAGKSYINDVNDEEIYVVLKSGNFTPTNDVEKISSLDVIIICVPTPLNEDKNPNTSYIKEVVSNIKKYGKKQSLIILESTTYPGSTEELIMDSLNLEGWVLNKDYNLCFSPERVDPGNKSFNIINTPKIVGGLSKECTELGSLFYKKLTDSVYSVSSAAAAEMVKLLENTFRCINIALINEMTLMCEKMGINIWEVIEAAATKPFGYMAFYPGPGVGGHCIPIDPVYLNWKAKSFNFESEFITLATKINESMPEYVINSVEKLLIERGKKLVESKILVVGVAYKKDIDDIRESPGIRVIDLLMNYHVAVDYYDPFVKRIELKGKTLHSIELLKERLEQYDCVIITTNHTEIDYNLIIDNAFIIYDTRNSFERNGDNIVLFGGGINR